MNDYFTDEVRQGLLAPFSEIDFLPRAPRDGKALALPYINARDVMTRLDAVVGQENWSFDFDLLHADGKMVKGRLTVYEAVKCDAGEAGPEDEPLKSAVSDALKRAAVLFGIGRYLYHLPRVWGEYDPQRRQFKSAPSIPAAAINRALQEVGYRGTLAPPPVSPIDAHNARQREEERAIRSDDFAGLAQKYAADLRELWRSKERTESLAAFTARVLDRPARAAGTDLAGHVADLKAVLETLGVDG